ncbi:MAG TPA: Asp-tRNA(Asn)/Glu-tRNA(Gln) amidotransferase subunit GatC [Candidatus Peribacteraceae bacterium]|nr:Asp-tRNA(Asn)/Glu-tRNA(Gln) amidotransferase subunit GatC [Candidatus Peribacteraceae bacterium]
MTQLTADQVRHIAKLARLRLKEDELEKYAKELTSILKYIETLGEVDTSKVEATAQVTGMENRFREDAVWPEPWKTEELLGTTGLPITEQQIQTPSAHG